MMSELIRSSQMEASRLRLEANQYPGRVAIMGFSEDGSAWLQAYAIMGRSTGSRDRVFVQEGTSVRTTAPRKTPEEMAATPMSELIYYRALRTNDSGLHVVSNGAQTNPIFESIMQGKTLEEAAREAPVVDGVDLASYEPDEPNFTPRISGVIDLRADAPTPFGLVVVSKGLDGQPSYAVRTAELEGFMPGEGYGIQTYNGNGDPLPSFDQEPFAFPMGHNAVDTAHNLWDTLNQVNRVSVVVRAINPESGQAAGTAIINATA